MSKFSQMSIPDEMEASEYLQMMNRSRFAKGRVSAKHVWINQSQYLRIFEDKADAQTHAKDANDTLHFASESEAFRYQHLRLEQDEGLIVNLMHQPSFDLVIIGDDKITWQADFQYQLLLENEKSIMVIEDVKSYQEKTDKWFVANGETKLKMKMFEMWRKHFHPTWSFYLVDGHSGYSCEYHLASFV